MLNFSCISLNLQEFRAVKTISSEAEMDEDIFRYPNLFRSVYFAEYRLNVSHEKLSDKFSSCLQVKSIPALKKK